MIGTSSTLIDRKGGFIIPKIVDDGVTKKYTMMLPQGTIVIADNAVVLNSAKVTPSLHGFICDQEEYVDVEFSVPKVTPVTIYSKYRSIMYVDEGAEKEYYLIKNMTANDEVITVSDRKIIDSDKLLLQY